MKNLLIPLVGLMLGLALIQFVLIVFTASDTTSYPPMDGQGRTLISQRDFPCQEDEVLGFATADLFKHVSVLNIDADTASRNYVVCYHLNMNKEGQ